SHRVMGLSGALDGSRMEAFIAMELGVSIKDVRAMVIGGHANEMVPLKEYSTVRGIPITKLMSAEKIDAIDKRTRTAGGEIVALLKTGSAYYAPSRAAAEMAEAVLLDQKRIIPSAVYCDGKYGIDGIFIGLPAVLGAGGVEDIIELELSEGEKADLNASVSAIKALIDDLEL
ncbi:MAG: malate dehydrogenase, partial [Thermodesulfobacteriota bacterium]